MSPIIPGSSRARVDVGIPYEEDLDRVMDILQKLTEELAERLPGIVEGPRLIGVVELNPSQTVIRIEARAEPMKFWQIERELRRAIKNRLHQEGISWPYPHYVVFPGGPKGENRDEGEKNS